MEKLKGDLFNKYKENLTKFSEEWLKFQILVQRDGGDKYKVEDIAFSEISNKKIVKLVSLSNGPSVTKEFSNLIENLKTTGSPWMVEG